MTIIREIAPAKVNLYLHLTGVRDDGYHLLDSLVCFTDFGDELEVKKADGFNFCITGNFASHFSDKDKDASERSTNLVVKAAREISALANKPLNLEISLKKNLPLESGLGGGSSDAAATIRAICKLWNIPMDAPEITPILKRLGADVPVCFEAKTRRMSGIGEILDEPIELPELKILMAKPPQGCSTKEIFSLTKKEFKPLQIIPDNINEANILISFLTGCDNDLQRAAEQTLPEISYFINHMKENYSPLLTRMSGSGSACFALFDNDYNTSQVIDNLRIKLPTFWLSSGKIIS